MATLPPATQRVAYGARRLVRAWRALAPEQRLATATAAGLFVTMLLPWYRASFPTSDRAYSAVSAFSWVEAAVLVTVLGVLALMFARAERRAFHLPGGDGLVVTAAGAWSFFLIGWRLFDRPELGRGVAVGLKWGVYVGLVAAAALAYAGHRLRAAQRPEPPLFAGHEPRAPDATGAGREVRLPDERPHLADTEVLGDDRGSRRRGDGTASDGSDSPTHRLGPRPSGR